MSIHQWSAETEVQSLVKSYKRLKVVLDAALLYLQHYKMWLNPENREAPPMPCCSY